MTQSDINATLRMLLQELSNGKSRTPDHLDDLCRDFREQLLSSEEDRVEHFNREDDGFRDRCYRKWKSGFDLIRLFRYFCIEIGSIFQKEFCQYEAYLHDPLLGVLMRQHAHACRIMGEVEVLMRNGYSDGAFARWRTLHEIAVTSILIREHGRQMAEDFIRFGVVEAVKGMEAYQETAEDMEREPYAKAELDTARKIRDQILEKRGEFNGRGGWAIPYVNAGKFEKLQECAGLTKWKTDYKWASQNIHSNYREMRELLGMVDAKEDVLLTGPSNSGFTEPAHSSAIALGQVTSAFLTCHIDDDYCPIDFTFVSVCLPTMNFLIQEVGQRFIELKL